MMTPITRLDKAAWSVLSVIAALIAILVLLGNPQELQAGFTAPQELVGPWGPLALSFTHPVQAKTVQQAIRIEPQTPGRFEMDGPQTLRFIPSQPLQPEIAYRLSLRQGPWGLNGERLARDLTWTFRVRPAQVVYLAIEPGPAELWRIDLDGADPFQLTYTGGQVYDFAVSPDGESIIYTRIGEAGGSNLWQVGREGGEARLLLACEPDLCSTPAWARDGLQIAFTRQAAPLKEGGAPGAPRPWLLDPQSGLASRFYSDPQTLGYGPSWSPDGQRMAAYDGISGGIRVLDLRSGDQSILPTQSGSTGDWSPDGSQLLFVRVETAGSGFRTFIYRADLQNNEITTFIDGSQRDAFYGPPAWSPDGQWVAVSLRPRDLDAGRALWIVDANLLNGKLVADDPQFTLSAYRWDPWGRLLLSQRNRLGGRFPPEIALVDPLSGEVRLLATGGAWPQWLP